MNVSCEMFFTLRLSVGLVDTCTVLLPVFVLDATYIGVVAVLCAKSVLIDVMGKTKLDVVISMEVLTLLYIWFEV